jgi:glucuronoarabinoxylan endo-1,4-beta-xylanase
MSIKRLYMCLLLISPLIWSPCYGADPCMIKLDINIETANDDANTQPGFTKFILPDSGSEVNGVTIDLDGDIQSARRDGPYGIYFGDPPVYYPRAGERIYRDFIFGTYPSGVTITLWGLGTNRDCNITIWAFDDQSTGEANRVANWYANGTYIFDTNFMGGMANWPKYEGQPGGAKDLYKYAFSGRGTTDNLGRIILTSNKDPCSPEGQPFAFVNAIQVEPNTAVPFVPPKYAHHPVPADGAEDVPIDVILEWKKGGYAEKHDVYLGTDEAKVTDANRSIPLGVLVSENHSTTTYDPPELLDLNTTYYWRIDEVNSAPDYTIFKGEVWSFMTLPYFVMEDFDSYADNAALRNVWKNDSTSAEVSIETDPNRSGPPYQSMRYRYKNNLPPYSSQAYVDIADLGIDDPNWLGIGAKTLVLYFYGEPTNPISEQMYVSLTDGDNPAKTATVTYGNTNNARLKQWNKWSIALTEFTDVNLANVARITIGFGDGSPGNAGTVYFEDITLDSAEAEVLPEITGAEVNVNIVYQQLEGFGGSACYDASLLTSYAYRETVYDLLFRDLGMDILRIKNTYDFYPDEVTATGVIVAEAKEATRNPNLKTFLLPWSPPAYLKDTNALGSPYNNGTLKKDANDPNWPPYYYVYDQYATWWLNSLIGPGGFNSVGIYPDYISIQNEPDWGIQDQECRFTPTENSTYAGYDKAFEAVYNRIDGNVSPMPKMLAPESVGFGSSQVFIDALDARGQMDNIYGFSHHLYGDGSYSYPDGMISGMIDYHNNYGYKPLFQTEFGGDDPPTFNDAVLLAQHIHNCLVYEGVTSYFQWTSFRASYTTGGMINLKGEPEIRDLYWFFKHYAYFTDPNWYRVYATPSPSSVLRMTAFKSPDSNQLTVVILNKSSISINLTLNLNGFPLDNSEMYRSSETEHWAYIGPFYEAGSLMLPAYSITTISNVALSNCDSVLVAGYGLTSDIQPDCYVNYKDLKIITDYWLNTECDLYGDCEGADFEPDGDVDFVDFSRFAEQWLWCNNPNDEDCGT